MTDEAGVVLRSDDGGDNWTKHRTPVRVPRPLITFVDSQYGWIAGGVANTGQDGIILHSSDGGLSWVEQARSISHFIKDIEFVDRDHGWVLARGRFDGPEMIISTANGGLNWDTVATMTEQRWNAIDFIDELVGWGLAYTYNPDSAYIYRTVDGGMNWTQQFVIHDSFFGDISFHSRQEGWATSSAGNLWHTLDGGETWSIEVTDPNMGGSSKIEFADEVHGWITARPYLSYIHTTNDGGHTWTTHEVDASVDLNVLACGNEQCVWTAGSDGHVFRSCNAGMNWNDISYRRDWNGLRRACFIDSLRGWLIGGDNTGGELQDAIWYTGDGGWSWTDQHQGISTSLKSIAFVDENNGWILGNRGTILHTTDSGHSWNLQNGLEGYSIVEFDFKDTENGVAVADNAVFVTEDGGENWEQHTLEWNGLLDIAYADAQNIWAVGHIVINPDSLFYEAVVVHSSNGGQDWSRFDFNGNLQLSEVTFSDSLTGFFTALWGAMLFRTQDGGQTWIQLNPPAWNMLSHVSSTNRTDIWAVSEYSNIIHSTDAGDSWTTEPLTSIGQLYDLVPWNSENVWALSIRSGLYRYGGSPLPTGDFVNPAVPISANLTVFPNPFNSNTSIRLEIPVGGHSEIAIYDINGRLVRSLVDRFLPRGSYQYSFEAINLPSGCYFVNLNSETVKETRRMILIR